MSLPVLTVWYIVLILSVLYFAIFNPVPSCLVLPLVSLPKYPLLAVQPATYCLSWFLLPTLSCPSPVFCKRTQYLSSLFLPNLLSVPPLATLIEILNPFLQNLPCTRSTISHPPFYSPNFDPKQQPHSHISLIFCSISALILGVLVGYLSVAPTIWFAVSDPCYFLSPSPCAFQFYSHIHNLFYYFQLLPHHSS